MAACSLGSNHTFSRFICPLNSDFCGITSRSSCINRSRASANRNRRPAMDKTGPEWWQIKTTATASHLGPEKNLSQLTQVATTSGKHLCPPAKWRSRLGEKHLCHRQSSVFPLMQLWSGIANLAQTPSRYTSVQHLAGLTHLHSPGGTSGRSLPSARTFSLLPADTNSNENLEPHHIQDFLPTWGVFDRGCRGKRSRRCLIVAEGGHVPSRSLPHNLPLQTAAAIVVGKLLVELSHDAFRVHTKGRSWMEHHHPMHKR